MDYPQDSRTVKMMGPFGSDGAPRPLTREALVEVATEWPVSEHTPEEIAGQLRVARDLFVHCLLVWEFGAVGVAWSLLAVESCLRWALGVNKNERFVRLIERARGEGLVTQDHAKRVDAGRQLRNKFSHPSNQSVLAIGSTAPAIGASHDVVYDVSEAVAARAGSPTTIKHDSLYLASWLQVMTVMRMLAVALVGARWRFR